MLENALAPRRAHATRQRGIAEDLSQALGKCLHVATRDKETGLALHHLLVDLTHVGRDDGPRRGHRLEHHHREPLDVATHHE